MITTKDRHLNAARKMTTPSQDIRERGGRPASARALGNYERFLDILPTDNIHSGHRPRLTRSGDIAVSYTFPNQRSTTASITFLHTGGIELGVKGPATDTSQRYESFDGERIEQFIFASN